MLTSLPSHYVKGDPSLKRTKRVSSVDGNHILYHYLEKDLREKDIWLFQMLAARLFTSLGIWFSTTLYARIPILLPFAVRDPSCRPKKTGEVDQWGAPNASGYFRDDNSLVKGLPKSLRIKAPQNPLYHGRAVGGGFVAAHVWRGLEGSSDVVQLSTRDALTNTFIPNLVWLPIQVAKLTDREGSFAQSYLQALAIKIYRHVPVARGVRPMVEQAWQKLPNPAGVPSNGLPEPGELAYFEETARFLFRRYGTISTVRAALDRVADGRRPKGKVISSRYTKGLPQLKPDSVSELREMLGILLQEVDVSGKLSQ